MANQRTDQADESMKQNMNGARERYTITYITCMLACWHAATWRTRGKGYGNENVKNI